MELGHRHAKKHLYSRCMRVACLLFLLAAVYAGRLWSQELLRQSLIEEQDTLKITTLGFERALNTFLWNGRLSYEHEFGGIGVKFGQRVRSRLIRTDQRSIQDEYATTLDVNGQLDQNWNLSAQLHSTGLSDNRAIDLGKLAQHRLLAGAGFSPSHLFQIKVLGGYQFDSQESEQDQGFSYLLEAEGRNVAIEEFRATFYSKWAQAFLAPRKPSQGSVDLRLLREFGTEARNTLSVGYSTLRREFYTPAEQVLQELFQVQSNIFRREAVQLEINELLEYQPAANTRITFHGGVLDRTIDRGLRYKNLRSPTNVVLDTRIQELQLSGSLVLSSRLTNWLKSDVTLSYHEREERHAVLEENGISLSVLEKQERSERRLENISRRTSISSQFELDISEKDQLTFGGTASILRYDTPDTLNVDDRDELLVTFGIQETHRFSQHLAFSVLVDATLSHLVYLSRFQSANNSWNRILRFSPKVEYNPSSWFRSTNIAEVLANYTVYDFEEQVALVKSFSFRQASWIDSTSIRLTRQIALDFVGGIRVYERGILRWKEFKERPQNYFMEQTYWPRMVWMKEGDLRIGVGFRFFGQDRYRSEGKERFLERRLVSLGPTVEIEWMRNDDQAVSLIGWRETQSQDGAAVRTISNLSLRLSMTL